MPNHPLVATWRAACVVPVVPHQLRPPCRHRRAVAPRCRAAHLRDHHDHAGRGPLHLSAAVAERSGALILALALTGMLGSAC